MEHAFDHIDELIGKYLAGEASPGERAGVEEWLHANEENQKYFNQLKTIFEGASGIKEWQQFDTDAAWSRVKEKLKGQGARTIPLKPPGLSLYWRVAASALLVLSIGYLISRLWSPAVETFVAISDKTTQYDTLPDGSTAFLNKASVIAYEHHPRKKVRRVRLTGEAYFDVLHLEEKPFVIEAEEVIIEDIGTTFNVKAYPGSSVVEVFVESGEVAFYTKQNPGLHLRAGETGVYDKTSKLFTRESQPDTNVLAYKTRVFSFYNTDLGSIVDRLNEVYEKKIILGNEKLKSCRIHVAFKGEPIETIADIIAETLNLKMTVSDQAIFFDGEGCE